MDDVINALASLKDKYCQWMFLSSESRVRFDGQMKSLSECNFFYNVSVKFKANKPMYLSLNKPLSMKKEETDKMLRYHIYSNDTLVLIVGYLKD